MGDKFRICAACGRYISVYMGQIVKDADGYWFVHRNRNCRIGSLVIADETRGEITGFKWLANGQVLIKRLHKENYELA